MEAPNGKTTKNSNDMNKHLHSNFTMCVQTQKETEKDGDRDIDT